jgi:hypothetical protein
MSHYIVAVFTEDDGKTIDELLEPYYEEREVPQYVSYTKEQLIENYKKHMENYKNSTYAEFLADPEKYKADIFDQAQNNPFDNEERAERHIKYLEEEFPQRLLWTDEEIYQHEIQDYESNEIDENGSVLSTSNPEGYWDWYEIGGRADGFLRVNLRAQIIQPNNKDKNKSTAFNDTYTKYMNSARVRDIDFSPDPESYKRRERFWDVVVDGAEPTEKEAYLSTYNPQYYLDRYGTKENYATLESSWYTRAVVLPDGSWHEMGRMGWWGISSETDEEAIAWLQNYKKTFIDTANPDWTLTIVDCHI